MTDLDTSMKKKQRIAEQSVSLMRDVRTLEKDSHSFATLITRFYSIDIASRIEVTKQFIDSVSRTISAFQAAAAEEEQYLEKIKRETGKGGEVTLF